MSAEFPSASRSSSRSRGSRNKYEFDEKAGVFRLDRVLSSAVYYNFEYGFIEGTRADDGDHTDALLLIDEPTFTGVRVWARPIGVLEMHDEKGADYKVLCVAEGDPHQAHVERLEQVRPHRLVEIEHFFQTYKLLEDKTVEIHGWRDADRPGDPPPRPRDLGARAGHGAMIQPGGRSADLRPRGSRPRGGRWEAPVDPPVLRLFFAVPVPAEARDRVGQLIDKVQREVGDGTARIRWVRVDGLHLTPVPGPDAGGPRPAAPDAADALARAVAPFEVHLSGGGAFPSLARPRSLWVGVRGRRSTREPRRRAHGGGDAACSSTRGRLPRT